MRSVPPAASDRMLAKVAALLAGAVVSLSAAAGAQAATLEKPPGSALTACRAMTAFAVPGLKVLSADLAARAAIQTRGQTPVDLPEHCIVRGELDHRIGADGKPYAIGFELRLPTGWTGRRFLFQGGAGTDGVVSPAYGLIPLGGSRAAPALARGFAVVSMDSGHHGQDSAFGHDPQARRDYGNRALGRVTATAKTMVQAFYQQPISHSYFMGCSNGGRQAFMATQRFPNAFDGVIAGAPGFALTEAAVAELWDTDALWAIAPRDARGERIFSQALTDADLKRLADAVLRRCDALDGLADGMVNDMKACAFDPAVLQCAVGASGGECLSADKVKAIRTVFDGAHDSHGRALFASWPYDPGVGAANWRQWKLGTSTTAKINAQNVTLGLSSLSDVFTTPPEPLAPSTDADFDAIAARTKASAELINAVSTDLTRFRAHGGKLLVVQGAADPVFSAHRLLAWYEGVRARGGAADYSRVYVVPGMNHCGGGPATDDIDPLTATVAWVEQGKAPERLTARGDAFPGLSRPLCPYPSVARYSGGDIKDEKSFACR